MHTEHTRTFLLSERSVILKRVWQGFTYSCLDLFPKHKIEGLFDQKHIRKCRHDYFLCFYEPSVCIRKSAFVQQCMFLHSLSTCEHACSLYCTLQQYVCMTVCVHASYLCIHIYSTCVCVCVLREEARIQVPQSGSISSGRPQSWPPRGKLPTVGTSRDDCPCWGDCTCALTYKRAHSHTDPHTQADKDLHIHMYLHTCM